MKTSSERVGTSMRKIDAERLIGNSLARARKKESTSDFPMVNGRFLFMGLLTRWVNCL